MLVKGELAPEHWVLFRYGQHFPTGGATSYALVRLREDEKKKRLLLASSLNGDVEQPPPNGRAVPVSDVPHNKVPASCVSHFLSVSPICIVLSTLRTVGL